MRVTYISFDPSKIIDMLITYLGFSQPPYIVERIFFCYWRLENEEMRQYENGT